MLTQEERTRQNRERILTAARAIIREHGIDALSIRKLAAQSGLALRTIYNLFGNKENVIITLFEQGSQVIEEATAELQHTLMDQPWETAYYTQIIDLIEKVFLESRSYIKPAIIAGFSFQHAGSAKMARMHDRRIKSIHKILKTAVGKNLIWDDLDLEVCAQLLYRNYAGVVLRWANGELDDAGLVLHGRYAMHTILYTLINAPDRRENTLNLLRNLKEEK